MRSDASCSLFQCLASQRPSVLRFPLPELEDAKLDAE